MNTMDKAPFQVPFSTCFHSSCSRCSREKPDDQFLESTTGHGQGLNRATNLSKGFSSDNLDDRSKSETRPEGAGQTRRGSWGERDTTHGPRSPTLLADTTKGGFKMTQESSLVRGGAYRELLPTRFLNKHNKLERTLLDIQTFIKEDLNLNRLNHIHGWLWLVGRPEAGRPLHRQLMRKRVIVVTEQMDLHLTWNDSCLYIKPLPAHMLCTEFWKDYLCEDSSLYENACGFLLSYSWLICYNSDFLIATNGYQAPCLLPSTIDWPKWQSFVGEFLNALDSEDSNIKINRRYEYGELRLARLNFIYRYAPLWWYRHLFRGYYYGYHEYSSFFSRNFAWLIIAFAYMTVVLSAMQVALGVDGFKDDPRLKSASYGFSVFSMVLVVTVLVVVNLLFVTLFIYNLIATALVHVSKTGGKPKDRKRMKDCKDMEPQKARDIIGTDETLNV